MAPQGWTTAEERGFLTSFIPEYEACQVKRRYKAFWQRVNAEFLNKFPIIDKLFPGQKITELTLEQKEMHTAAVIKQQQRLKEWFRWQMNPRSRNAGTVITKRDLHTIYNGKTRLRKPYEVFAKLYADEVEKVKAARCEADGITGRRMLNVWQDVSRELFFSASDEQKVAVKEAMEAEEREDSDDARTPAQYLRYLKKLPTLLDATITPAVRKAGILAFVTMVGPDPEQNGKISCKTLQFGDKPETPVFAQEWDGHDTVFVEALARFASMHEYSPEECLSRSLRPGANSQASDEEDKDEDSPISRPASTPPNTSKPAPSPIRTQSTKIRAEFEQDSLTRTTPSNSPTHSPTTLPVPTPMLFLPERNSTPPHLLELDEPQMGSAPSNLRPSSLVKHPALSFSHQNLLSPPSASAYHGHAHGMPGDLRKRAQPSAAFGGEDDLENESDEDDSGDLWDFTAAHQNALDMSLLNIGTPSQDNASGLPPVSQHAPFFTATSTPSAMLFRKELTSARALRPSSDDNPPDAAPSTNAVATCSVAPVSMFPPSRAAAPRSVLSRRSIPITSHDSPPLPHLSTSHAPPLHPSALSGSVTPPMQSPPSLFPHAQSSFAGLSTSTHALPPSHPSRHGYLSDKILYPSSQSSTPASSMLGSPSRSESQAVPLNVDNLHPGLSSVNPPPAPQRPQQPSIGDSRLSDLISPGSASNGHPVGNGSSEAYSLVPAFGPNLSSEGCPAPLTSSPGHTQVVSLTASGQNVATDQISHFFQGTLTANAPQNPTAVDTAPALLPSNQVVESPPSSLPPNQVVQPLASSIPSNPVTQPLPSNTSQSVHASESSAPLLDSTCRRSTRGSVPSKRNQQLQLIGMNTAPTPESDEIEGASWFTLALEHLRTFDLGDEWSELVDKWGQLEAILGYGKTGKGTLPTAGRPEEWQKWTSKTWHGTRRYDKMPQIDSAADLAIAFGKWWLSLQPSFRVSKGPYPLPVFAPPKSAKLTDPWATLRKSGQNGFVAVVLLLGWWGHVAETATSSWEDDSRPAWKHLVSDVHGVIDAMITTAQGRPTPGTKRPRSSEKENIAPGRKQAKRTKRA